MRLYVVRHGETDWNREARLQGQRDTPLNALGRAQAAAAAGRVAALVPDPARLDYVASPLARTRDTMEILRAGLGLAPDAYRVDERLRELSFGQWEGSTWREIRARDPQRALARERDRWNAVPPGGESYAMLAVRLAPFLSGLTRDALIVTHGGVARAMLAAACGVSEDRAPRIDIWQGRVLVIDAAAFRWA